MRTIKLVIIGDSGVGKTSIRGKYIDGRFSTGYRATIGTDFITKTVQHHSKPDENVTLQIWDTAGQERFSGLSAAFFRGADAAMLVFDVNKPQTLEDLRKWWGEFKVRAPVPDGEEEDYCCVVVGNKMDLIGSTSAPGTAQHEIVTETEALTFLDELVPRLTDEPDEGTELPHVDIEDVDDPDSMENGSRQNGSTAEPSTSARTQSINILRPSTSASLKGLHRKYSQKSFSRSRSPLRGTMTTSRTNLSIYHTPSSSLFESSLESASSSPPITTPLPPPPDISCSPSLSPSRHRQARRLTSASSSSSGTTITPSLFFKKPLNAGASVANGPSDTEHDQPPRLPLPQPEKRPHLFFTSAKTGDGLTAAFEYVAQRVVTRWEYEEDLEARMMHIRDTTEDTLRLDGSDDSSSRARKWTKAFCCGT